MAGTSWITSVSVDMMNRIRAILSSVHLEGHFDDAGEVLIQGGWMSGFWCQ
jgi:hypothetical protein